MKVEAILKISTKKGYKFPGEVFEVNKKVAERLIEHGAARLVTSKPTNTKNTSSNTPTAPKQSGLNELNKEEMLKLAQKLEIEIDESRDIPKQLKDFIQKDENYHELLDMTIQELRDLINE